MKVDAAVQRLLLDLADSDAEINRLVHRRKTLPEDAEIAEHNSAIDAARDDLVRAVQRKLCDGTVSCGRLKCRRRWWRPGFSPALFNFCPEHAWT